MFELKQDFNQNGGHQFKQGFDYQEQSGRDGRERRQELWQEYKERYIA